MTCTACLIRRRIAIDLWPCRRPLYVRCGACKMRRRAHRHIAGRVALVVLGAVFAITLVWAVGR